MIDYTLFYKQKLQLPKAGMIAGTWDLFLSALTKAVRVAVLEGASEDELILDYLNRFEGDALAQKRVCVDATDFLRPHLLCFLAFLMHKGVRQVDVLYSEPAQYAKQEKTEFSKGNVTAVRQVALYSGSHPTTHEEREDLLILGLGFEGALIRMVANDKHYAKKVQMFGLPSLRSDMYQQNVLRAYRARESVGLDFGDERNNYFASAHDPFVTASVLQQIVTKEGGLRKIPNLYLCPLGIKGTGSLAFRALSWARPAPAHFLDLHGYSEKVGGVCRGLLLPSSFQRL